MKAKQTAKTKKPLRRRPAKAASSAKARSVRRSTTATRTKTVRRPAKAARKKTAKTKRAAKTTRRAAPRRTPVKRAARTQRSQPPALRRPRRQPPVAAAIPDLPEILFEGDRPGVPPAGPDVRFALGATAPTEPFAGEGELPEAYGTQQVLVTPRDPHWLYVHWDLTREQLREYNAQSMHKHLVLRVATNGGAPEPLSEVHVHPESRHWFVHVAEAGRKYVVELGYYGKARGWTRISTSTPTLAPPAAGSSDTTTRFATIPMEVALTRLVDIVKAGAGGNPPLAHTLEELRRAGHPDLPPVSDGPAARPWTPEQERALAEVISLKQFGRVSVGSLDITELVQRGLSAEFSSIVAALAGPGGLSSASSLSSPTGGAPAAPGEFWLNVNAELIVYGATDPNASVTLGGQVVKLRPDGSFSFRFALPDGQYELPVTAVSADGTEARHADLHFRRATTLVGDVGQQPSDPALKPPTPENGS
jgi:hypothetical protein